MKRFAHVIILVQLSTTCGSNLRHHDNAAEEENQQQDSMSPMHLLNNQRHRHHAKRWAHYHPRHDIPVSSYAVPANDPSQGFSIDRTSEGKEDYLFRYKQPGETPSQPEALSYAVPADDHSQGFSAESTPEGGESYVFHYQEPGESSRTPQSQAIDYAVPANDHSQGFAVERTPEGEEDYVFHYKRRPSAQVEVGPSSVPHLDYHAAQSRQGWSVEGLNYVFHYSTQNKEPPVDDCQVCIIDNFPQPCADLRAQNSDKTWDYLAAFDGAIVRLKAMYAFSEHKRLDWEAIKADIRPQVEQAAASSDRKEQKELFIIAMKRLVMSIHDMNVGLEVGAACPDMEGSDGNAGPDEGKAANTALVFEKIKYDNLGGGFGFTLSPLDSGTFVVTSVQDGSPAAKWGVQVGDEVLSVDNKPIDEAAKDMEWLNYDHKNPATAEHIQAYRYRMVVRAPVGTTRLWKFYSGVRTLLYYETHLDAVDDGYWSFQATTPKRFSRNSGSVADARTFSKLELLKLAGGYGYLPVSGERWKTEDLDDVMQEMRDLDMKGLLIDIRGNAGGGDENSKDLQGRLNPGDDRRAQFYQYTYVRNQLLQEWCENQDAMRQTFIRNSIGESCDAYSDDPGAWTEFDALRSSPIDPHWHGPVVALVNEDCKSAGEGIAMAVSKLDSERAAVVGFSGTAGSFGMSRGEIWLPEYVLLVFPWGQSRDYDRQIQIDADYTMEGGVYPTSPTSTIADIALVETGSSTQVNSTHRSADIPGGRIPKNKKNVIGAVSTPPEIQLDLVERGEDVEVNYALKVLKALAHDETRPPLPAPAEEEEDDSERLGVSRAELDPEIVDGVRQASRSGRSTWDSWPVWKKLLAIFINAFFWLIVAIIYSRFRDRIQGQPIDYIDPSSTHRWFSTSLFGCFSNPMICLLACCCPAMRWADTMDKAQPQLLSYWKAIIALLVLMTAISVLNVVAGYLTSICSLIVLALVVSKRQQLRDQNNVKRGDITYLEDCCAYMCCSCCAIAQEARVVEGKRRPAFDPPA